MCNCNHGYTGSVCEVVINNCEPNPCSNGGTCINMADDFQCECDEGYEGDICETGIVSLYNALSERFLYQILA